MHKDGQPDDDDNTKTEKLHNVQVKNIEFVDQYDEGHGVILKVAKVTILDMLTNETIVLTQGEVYAPTDNQLYVLKTDDPFPAQEWDVSKQSHDQPLEFPGSLEGYKDTITFKVVALDFTKPSVTVEKDFTPQNGKPKSITRELFISDTTTPSPDQPPPDASPAPAAAPAN